MYNSLGAAIVDDGRFDFDNYVKKACPMMLVEDTLEKKATTSKYFIKFYKNLKFNYVLTDRQCKEKTQSKKMNIQYMYIVPASIGLHNFTGTVN